MPVCSVNTTHGPRRQRLPTMTTAAAHDDDNEGHGDDDDKGCDDDDGLSMAQP
jgi:hypothetical protein